MFAKLFSSRLMAVAGLLTFVATATAADATPPPAPAMPISMGCSTGCYTGCDSSASLFGPVLGGYTGFGSGAGGNGIGLFAPNRRNWRGIDGQNQPGCANNTFPLSDWLYIRRFCGPTIIPGTCYGHFQTKWRRWEDHCPQQNGGYQPSASGVGCDNTIYGAPAGYPLPVQTAPAPQMVPVPMPMPSAPRVNAQPSQYAPRVATVPAQADYSQTLRTSLK